MGVVAGVLAAGFVLSQWAVPAATARSVAEACRAYEQAYPNHRL